MDKIGLAYTLVELDNYESDHFLKKFRSWTKKAARKIGDVAKTAVNLSPIGLMYTGATKKSLIGQKHLKSAAFDKFDAKSLKARSVIGKITIAAAAVAGAVVAGPAIGAALGIGKASVAGASVIGAKKGILPKIKNFLGGAVNKVKSNPVGTLQSLQKYLTPELQETIAMGLTSKDPMLEQIAAERLAYEQALVDASLAEGETPTVQGISNNTLYLIGGGVLLVIILIIVIAKKWS